ncbi:single-stranded DNA-binding protein [Anaerococcus sp. Marseille-P3915]|uniref:single-stranded DNA-binding protein n=1 Tax=Anaerococcus sp. Marseille-P3915 TaxID=2057799 RepID=UPI000D0BC3A5|nr:single-stranded DNA-binding protein [Anaerococcus sp. Marseille-P3915]
MNKVILIGRLTRDPELKYTQSNQAVCKFTLAVDKNLSKDKREDAEAAGRPTADFPRVIVWGKAGENASRYLFKGSQCAVDGRIQTGSYQDKDGKTIYTTDVIADRVEFLTRVSEEKRNDDGGRNTYQNNSGSSEEFFGDDFRGIEDDGRIPF